MLKLEIPFPRVQEPFKSAEKVEENITNFENTKIIEKAKFKLSEIFSIKQKQ
jgi:hypothetical protein